jgi:Uma2 family endonuclease
VAAPNPAVIVELPWPPGGSADPCGRLADYFRLPSVRHYLLVRPERPEIVHHRGAGALIETRVVTEGRILLDPLGIGFTVEEIYAD